MGYRAENREGKADRLLMAVAACGELPYRLAAQVTGSASYAAALVTKLKKAGMTGCRQGDGLKGYILCRRGKEYLLRTYQERMGPVLLGDAGPYPLKSEMEKRLRLHRMAYAWVQMYCFGADTFPGEFPIPCGSSHPDSHAGVYYPSVLIKSRIAKEAGGSRVCGLLDTGRKGFAVYHTMDSLMRWHSRTEWGFRMRAGQALYGAGGEQKLQGLMLAGDMSMLVRLLESNGGIKKQLYCLDDSYESFSFLPGCAGAGLQYRLLTDAGLEETLEEAVADALQLCREDGGGCQGTDAQGRPVYFLWLLDLWKVRQVKSRIMRAGRGKVVCLDYQADALREYLGEGAEVAGLHTAKVEAKLFSGTGL